MARKYLWKSNIFTKVTDCKSYSKVSQHFRQMANSYYTFCRHIQKNAFFCVKQYFCFQKESVRSESVGKIWLCQNLFKEYVIYILDDL